MKIKAAMLSLEYYGKDLVSIKEIENCKYADVRLGIENSSKTFVTRTHFWNDIEGNGENSFYTVIGFKIVHESDEDARKEFSLEYTSEYTSKRENPKDEYKKLDYKDGWFFEAPRFKRFRGEWQVLNSASMSSVGSIVAGSFFVRIFDDEDNWVKENDTYIVKVLPNGVSEEDFRLMIDDLFMIREELVHGESHQSIQAVYRKCLDDIYKMLDEITPALKRINAAPFTTIRQEIANIPTRKVKKFNNRVFNKLMLGNENGKAAVIVNKESSDIYEHEVLYDALLQLKEYLAKFEDYIDRDNKQDQKARNDEKKRIKDVLNGIDIDELGGKNRDEILKFIIDKQKGKNNLKDDLQGYGTNVYVPLESLGEKRSKLRRRYTKNGFSLCNRSKYSYIELTSFDFAELAALEHIFCQQGRFIIQGDITSDPIQKTKQGYSIVKFSFEKINTINGSTPVEFLKKAGIIDYENEFYKNWCENIVGKYNESFDTIERFSNYFRKGARRDEDNEKYREIAEQIKKAIDSLLAMDIFNDIKKSKASKSLKLAATQLFLNDRNYNFVFRQLKEMSKRHSYTERYDAKSIIISKVDKLYEYWVIISLIREFLRAGWNFSSCENYELSRKQLAKIIYHSIFKKGGESFPAEIRMYLELKNRSRIYFDLEYEKKIYYEENNPNAYKKPDYTMTFSLKQLNHKDSFIIYLDAKYRNYEEQGGIKGLNDDVENVAYKKYYKPFINTSYRPVASFIVHSHIGDKYTDWNMLSDKSILATGSWSNQDFDYYPLEIDRQAHRFGAFSLRPTESSNITTFIKLILEYFCLEQFDLDVYKEICIECGEADVNAEEKYTKGNKPKYHMTCQNSECNSFWVKNHCASCKTPLFKHYTHNFERLATDDLWLVICPKCGNKLD